MPNRKKKDAYVVAIELFLSGVRDHANCDGHCLNFILPRTNKGDKREVQQGWHRGAE